MQLEEILDSQPLPTAAVPLHSRMMKGLPRTARAVSRPAMLSRAVDATPVALGSKDVEMAFDAQLQVTSGSGDDVEEKMDTDVNEGNAPPPPPTTPPPTTPPPPQPPPPPPPPTPSPPPAEQRVLRKSSRTRGRQPVRVPVSVLPAVEEGPSIPESSPLTPAPESPEKRAPDSLSKYINYDAEL